MKRYAVLFVPALIGYLIVVSLLVIHVYAQTPSAPSSEDELAELDEFDGGDEETIPDTATTSESTTSSSQSIPRVQYGVASWYGRAFHGRATASGEPFDMTLSTAAHRSAPLGTHAIVTNLENGQAVRVRINDRGPFKRNRLLDLSYAAAQRLDMVRAGSARVKVEFLAAKKEPERAPESSPVEAPAAVMPATFFAPDGSAPERRQAFAGQRLQTASLPPGWFAVQAATYRELHHAVQMQKALRVYHPTVWIISVDDGSQVLHRVRVGPFAQRDEAEHVARSMVRQGFGLGTVVLQQ
jgi:rare lipoprotein A